MYGHEKQSDTIRLNMFHSASHSPPDQMELPCSTYALTLCGPPYPLYEGRDGGSWKGKRQKEKREKRKERRRKREEREKKKERSRKGEERRRKLNREKKEEGS